MEEQRVTFHTAQAAKQSVNPSKSKGTKFEDNSERNAKQEAMKQTANSQQKARLPVAVSGRPLPEHFKNKIKRYGKSLGKEPEWLVVTDGEPHITIFLNKESTSILNELKWQDKLKMTGDNTINIDKLPSGTPLMYDEFHVTINRKDHFYYDAKTFMPLTAGRQTLADVTDTTYSEGWGRANLKVEEEFGVSAKVINDYLNRLNPEHNLPGSKAAEVKEEKPVEPKSEKPVELKAEMPATTMMPPSVRRAMALKAAEAKKVLEKRPRTSSNEALNKQDREKVFKPNDPDNQ